MQCNFLLKAKQVPGKSNGIGESLSRQQIGHFRQVAPDADLHPTLILPSGDIGELTQMVKYCQSLPLNEKKTRESMISWPGFTSPFVPSINPYHLKGKSDSRGNQIDVFCHLLCSGA